MKNKPDKINNFKSDSNISFAGVSFCLAGMIMFMGIITAEIFYPLGYNTSINEISDLGSTRPPASLVFQPSSIIFSLTMIIAGIMILLGTYFLYKVFKKSLLSIALCLFGLGVFIVGIFPASTEVCHQFFAMIAFLGGGMSAIISSKIIKGPYRYISIILGSIILLSLFFSSMLILFLGSGGTERWVIYPAIIWLIAVGGYFLGANIGKENY